MIHLADKVMKPCCELASLILLAGVLHAAGPLRDRIDRADAVVIGRTDARPRGPNNGQFTITIWRVLKGSLSGSTAEVGLSSGLKGGGSPAVEPVCGIFFLQRKAGQLMVIPQTAPQLTFDAFYTPSDRCSANAPGGDEGIAPADLVIREVMHGAAAGPRGPRLAPRLFSEIRPSESTEAASASMLFSRASDRDLRLLGIAWRIAESDAAAMQELEKQLGSLDSGSALGPMLGSAIASYSNSDPEGIRSLGSIGTVMRDGALELPVSEALRSIHSKECLPYALLMLDSRNSRVRENAIATFSMFVLKVPRLSDSNRQEIFERALNPAIREKVARDVEQHVRFGAIADPNEEAEVVQWWRAWYQRTFHE